MFSAIKMGKTDSHCGIPCDTRVCGDNCQRMAMRDLKFFGALRCAIVQGLDGVWGDFRALPETCQALLMFISILHAQYDWTTGVPDNGWRVPHPPRANPLVAERAPWRSLQSCVTGRRQPIGNSYRFLLFLLHTWQPLCDPNSHSWGRLFQLPGS